jgi:hypothetical protein
MIQQKKAAILHSRMTFNPKDIDSVILGDNQFWGVNHASQDKGRETGKKFSNVEEVRTLMHLALDNGVTGVMLSTHPMIYDITDMMREDARLREHMHIYVNVPYIVKYVRMASEMGIVEALKNTLGGQGVLGSLLFMLKSARGVLTGNYLSLTNRLIDVEMAPFHSLKVKAIFLHNALTDLALGYDLEEVIRNFYTYVDKKYGVIPAFGTLNLSALDVMLEKAGVPPTLIMTAVNKNGFLMNPSREACEKTLQHSKHTVLAMATLASGTIPPDEAYAYLSSLPQIKNIVVGVSTQAHAEETFASAKKLVA